jgi:hypothetical protein
MNPHLTKETIMQFTDIENPFGTDAFTPPTTGSVKVKSHRLPKTRRSAVVRVLRNPTAPSTIIKNALLTW